jgi:ATP-dependent DNA helicase DinG
MDDQPQATADADPSVDGAGESGADVETPAAAPKPAKRTVKRPTIEAALVAAVAAVKGQSREGQLAMATAVADTINDGEHLLVQAGTGTGKSLAYLVPAMVHACATNGRVIVATATLALQHQLIARDLPRVADALAPLLGRRPTYAVLKGRHNYICLDRVHRGAAEPDEDEALFAIATTPLGRQAKELREWVDESETGDRDDVPFPVDGRVWRSLAVSGRECIGAAKCPYGQECFSERARETARNSEIVVTNHAMLAIHALEDVPVLPEHDAVIVDEGHELADRATQAVTAELSGQLVERAASRARRQLDESVHDRLSDAAEMLTDELLLAGGANRGTVPLASIEGGLALALQDVRDSCHLAITDLGSGRNRAAVKDDPEAQTALQRTKGLLSEVHDIAVRLLALSDKDVAWLETGERRPPLLRVAPLSVAGLLRTALFDETPVVITSATLTLGGSFDPVARGFGLPANQQGWTGLDVGSPFDHARQAILYVPKSVPPPGRDGVSVEALDELADLIGAAGGRTLALFSSWRGVERAAEHLGNTLQDRLLDRGIVPTDAPVLVQQRGDAVADLVRRFADEPRSILLGTLSLWQGVDVPGDSCTLVVIDRIPFPRPDDPLTAARSKAAEAAGSSGFSAVSVPRAALLLAQGVGRLIRSADDRGVVAVLDPRLATARYGDYLRKSLPPFWFTTDGAVVRAALTRLDQPVT